MFAGPAAPGRDQPSSSDSGGVFLQLQLQGAARDSEAPGRLGDVAPAVREDALNVLPLRSRQ